MKIRQSDAHFLVEGSKGDFYKVDLDKNTCNCPHFRYRLRGKGICKHIMAVKDLIEIDAKDDFEKALLFADGGVSRTDFIERFSLGLLNELIENQKLSETDGLIRTAGSHKKD